MAQEKATTSLGKCHRGLNSTSNTNGVSIRNRKTQTVEPSRHLALLPPHTHLTLNLTLLFTIEMHTVQYTDLDYGMLITNITTKLERQ